MTDDRTKEPRATGTSAGSSTNSRAAACPCRTPSPAKRGRWRCDLRQDLQAWCELHGYDAEARCSTTPSVCTRGPRPTNWRWGPTWASGSTSTALRPGPCPIGPALRGVGALHPDAQGRSKARRGETRSEAALSAAPSLRAREAMAAVSAPAAGPPKRPIIKLGALSLEEMERRRLALAGGGK